MKRSAGSTRVIPVRIGRVGRHCETRTENNKTEDLELDPKFDTAVTATHAGGYVDVVSGWRWVLEGQSNSRDGLLWRPITSCPNRLQAPATVAISSIHCRSPQLASMK